MANKPYTFSKHLETRLKEHNLKQEWIEDTIENPEVTEQIAADETHFFKKNTGCCQLLLESGV